MLVILCLSDELRVATLRSAALAFCGGKFTMLPKEEAGAFMQNHTELALRSCTSLRAATRTCSAPNAPVDPPSRSPP